MLLLFIFLVHFHCSVAEEKHATSNSDITVAGWGCDFYQSLSVDREMQQDVQRKTPDTSQQSQPSQDTIQKQNYLTLQQELFIHKSF